MTAKKTLTILPLLALFTLLVVAASMPKYVGKFYGDGVGLTNITGAVSPAQLVSATNLIYSAGTNAAKAYADATFTTLAQLVSSTNVILQTATNSAKSYADATFPTKTELTAATNNLDGAKLIANTVATNSWDATALAWVNSKGTGSGGSTNLFDSGNDLIGKSNLTLTNGSLSASSGIRTLGGSGTGSLTNGSNGTLFIGGYNNIFNSAGYDLVVNNAVQFLGTTYFANAEGAINFGSSYGYVGAPTVGQMLITARDALLVTTNIITKGWMIATNGVLLPRSNSVVKFLAESPAMPPASGSGTAFIYSQTNGAGTAEIFTMDGAGVSKQISEHAMDAPTALIDDNDEAPNISKEILRYTGKVRWINRSREARLHERSMKVLLNSLSSYQFLTGKTSTQWTNSNAFGQYTNNLITLDALSNDERQVVITETFVEYNTRNGFTTNSPLYLVQGNWTDDQNRLQAEYATGYTNAVNAALSDTNAVAPVWSPPSVQPVPAWLYKRGVR